MRISNLRLLVSLATLLAIISLVNGQKIHQPVDTAFSSLHNTTIKGQSIDYKATIGFQPVWDEKGMPVATLHYTYYTRENAGDVGKRPLLISFNGGPGSGSVWMHVAYTGPEVLNVDEEGYPVQPYGTSDNPFSVLDVADIVFVNPVNTGYSRTIPASGPEVDRSRFFGVNADIKYLAEWINTFVSRNQRWRSPKYIIGESYGGTRVAGLALALQEQQWMYLNGVIMVSPADYQARASDSPVSSSINLPYFTAAAWFHNKLPADLQAKDLDEVLPEAEAYAIDVLMPALAKGGFLSDSERNEIAGEMARFSGLTKEEILHQNLDIPTRYFWKALLRNDGGYTIGRLDSRYLGIDRKTGGEQPDYSAELTSWLHAFTPAINSYFSEELGFRTDLKYNMFGPVRPWDFEDNNVREDLRKAIAENPYLNVLVQSGYYDGATTYFNAKYTLMQLDPSGRLRDRLHFEGYRSGHMMYLRREDLEAANEHLREFIQKSSAGGKAAKYGND
ncbi:carboxypeptidase [Lewinellaceae bacterium SD302]|nr:carboxypeptidase [Lewinellaceae bacterium SD302]